MRRRVFFSGVVAVVALLFAAFAGAQTANARTSKSAQAAPDEQYVYVTGSNIPRKVKVRTNGVTNSSDNLRVYNQHQLERSGRAGNPADQLATIDPSISVRNH